MLVIIKAKAGTNQFRYPADSKLFSNQFRHPNRDKKWIVAQNDSGLTLDELTAQSSYVIVEYNGKVPSAPGAIRVIIPGAMQSRFSEDEEVAIVDGQDTKARVLLSRLLNAKRVRLDSKRLANGLTYILTYLHGSGEIRNGVSIETRLAELLVDGTEDEKYP